MSSAWTDTVTDFATDPPAPVQVSVYVVEVRAVRVCKPDGSLLPVHPLDAVHEVAPVLSHLRTVDCPGVRFVGVAESVSVGAGVVVGVVLGVGTVVIGGVTIAAATGTVTDFDTDPPAPVHVSLYVLVTALKSDCVPLVGLLPDHPPDAVHEDALVLDHLKFMNCPATIETGLSENVSVGAGTVLVDVGEGVVVLVVGVEVTPVTATDTDLETVIP